MRATQRMNALDNSDRTQCIKLQLKDIVRDGYLPRLQAFAARFDRIAALMIEVGVDFAELMLHSGAELPAVWTELYWKAVIWAVTRRTSAGGAPLQHGQLGDDLAEFASTHPAVPAAGGPIEVAYAKVPLGYLAAQLATNYTNHVRTTGLYGMARSRPWSRCTSQPPRAPSRRLRPRPSGRRSAPALRLEARSDARDAGACGSSGAVRSTPRHCPPRRRWCGGGSPAVTRTATRGGSHTSAGARARGHAQRQLGSPRASHGTIGESWPPAA